MVSGIRFHPEGRFCNFLSQPLGLIFLKPSSFPPIRGVVLFSVREGLRRRAPADDPLNPVKSAFAQPILYEVGYDRHVVPFCPKETG